MSDDCKDYLRLLDNHAYWFAFNNIVPSPWTWLRARIAKRALHRHCQRCEICQSLAEEAT